MDILEQIEFDKNLGVLKHILNNITLKILNTLKKPSEKTLNYHINKIIDEEIKLLKNYIRTNERQRFNIDHTLKKYYMNDLTYFLNTNINRNLKTIIAFYYYEKEENLITYIDVKEKTPNQIRGLSIDKIRSLF